MSRWTALRESYRTEYPVIRELTSDQRTKHDAKAHVVMEKLLLDFKYVPLESNRHVYMFKNEEESAFLV